MSIEKVEIESIHGAKDQQRLIFYRAQDHLGQWHSYGPIITVDPDFDIEKFKDTVAAKLENSLADAEFNRVLEG